MATFDQLSPEKRAIVELVLQQGKTYPELADMLGMPESRVRELARDALVELAPVSVRGVEDDWRGQLADYVLGQQSGPEATATKGHLRRSEAARSWARSLLDSLEQLYANGSVPAIPEGERGRGSRRAPAAAAASGPSAPAHAGAERTGPARGLASADPIMRRRLLAAAAAAAVVLLAVLVWPIGLLTGGDDESSSSSADNQPAPAAQTGDGSNIAVQTRGQAIIAEQAGKPQIFVTATKLRPSGDRSAYQVWLYNSNSDRKSLGAQVTDAQGNLQAGATLPSDYRDYRFIDVTNTAVDGQNLRTGRSVLRGLLQLREKPVTRGTGKRQITLLGQIQLLPLPGSG
jgi:Anti-sigma-K factor rskA/Sigma-70, region 4